MNNLVTFVCDNSDNGVALFGYGNELLQLCSYFKYLNDNLLYSSCSDVDQRSMVIAQHSAFNGHRTALTQIQFPQSINHENQRKYFSTRDLCHCFEIISPNILVTSQHAGSERNSSPSIHC